MSEKEYDYASMTKKELIELAKERNLSTLGNKNEIIEMLEKNENKKIKTNWDNLVENVKKSTGILKDKDYNWSCEECNEEFEDKESSELHEAKCSKLKAKLEKDEENARIRAEREKEYARIRAEREKENARIRAEREKENAKIRAEKEKEEKEINSHSYSSMKSDRRFPYHTYYISIIQVIAFLALIIYFFIGLMLIEVDSFLTLAMFMLGIISFFFIMLSSEVIRLILDFHDSNYTNTKVRIETLKTLKEISKNLKK